MKDWQWFALGLVPFAGMPVHAVRYMIEEKGPEPGYVVAGAIAGQGVAWGMQKAGFYKVNEALLLYRAASLGFVEEGAGATGYSLLKGKPVKGVANIRGSGVGWRPTFAMRMSSPVMVAMLIGTMVNLLRTDSPEYGDRYRANRSHYQPDFDQYV